MMNQVKEKKRKQWFYLFLVFLLVFSLSFLLMPLTVSTDGSISPLVYLVGSCFWIGLIGTIITVIIINSKRKSDLDFQNKHKNVKRLGLTHFFMNRYAKIADVAMVISFIGVIIFRLLNMNVIITFIFISLFVFSFGMHCMLNGINYIYLNTAREKGEN